MADLKLVRLTKGDTQEVFIDKLNQNFGRILSAGGGTFGAVGEAGPIGQKGPTGPTGDFGPPGKNGSTWYVDNSEPPTDLSAYNTGDHWVVASADYQDFVLTDSGWIATGINLTGTQFFKKIFDIENRQGQALKDAIIEFTQTPSSTTLVLSDSLVNSAFGNNQYSKFQISTLGQFDKNILEFSKSEYQDGGVIDAYKHPYFAWEDNLTPNNYSLVWGMTGGGFILGASSLFLASQTSDVHLGASGDISITSDSSLFLTSRGNLEIETSSDFTLDSGSLSLGLTGFSLSGGLKITTDSAITPGVTAGVISEEMGNVRVRLQSPNTAGTSDSEIFLTRVDHSNFANPLLSVRGNGDFKSVSLSQAYQKGLTVLSGSLGTYGPHYVDWASVSPSPVGSPGDSTLAHFNAIVVTPGLTAGAGTIGSPFNGVSFLGAYGALIGDNPLARVIGEGRSFSLTVATPDPTYFFQAVGIGTYSTPSDPFPNPAVASEWDILPFQSSSVTFHVMREENVGITGSWKVFYEANKSSGVLYE